MSATGVDHLTLEAVSSAAFRSTSETDELSQRVKDRLGFGAFNIPARLAIARSLAITELPPKVEGEPGRVIRGEVLFGSGPDLASWISLIIEHFGSHMTMKDLQGLVQRHWSRGMRLVADELASSDGDIAEFWRRLAESALPQVAMAASGRRPDSESQPLAHGPITVRLGEVGEDTSTGEPVTWTLNAAGGSPHSAFMGGVGSGKTRSAAFVLRSIAEQTGVPLLAFDFKGDMNDRNNALDNAFRAQVLSPPQDTIPLDVFALTDTSRRGVVTTAQRLRDSLSNLKQTKFGDQQRRRLNDALEEALRRQPCTLEDIKDCLENAYAIAGAREDGAISTMVDLCRLPLFEPTLSPAEFFSRSWIISLPASVPELVRVTVVALLTDALERYINSLPDSDTDAAGNRSLRVMCVIDEAHRILDARLPGLSNLIRLGRSKGAAVMLISQKPDDFESEDDDFLDEMGLLVCFGTNARETAVKRILGSGASLTTLKKGEAYARSRGDARSKKVLAWK